MLGQIKIKIPEKKKRREKLRRQQNTPCINKEKETHCPEVP
jgi:hypothetical protein